MGYHSSEDDIEVRYVRRDPDPRYAPPVRPSSRHRPYYDTAPYGVPDRPERLVIRARSHERSRSRDRHASNPPPAPAPAPAPAPQPVIINNRVYNDSPSDDDDYRQMRVVKSSRYGKHRSRSSSRSRSRSSRSRSSSFMKREDFQAEQTRKEFELLRLSNERDQERNRLIKEYQEDAELKRARQQLDDIKFREARDEEERQLRKDIDLKRMREQDVADAQQKLREKEAADAVEAFQRKELEKAAKAAKVKLEKEKEAADAVERYKQKELELAAKEREEKEAKEKEAKLAVERYKQKELEEAAKEREEKEARDKDYYRRMEADLAKSGLPEDHIAAIMRKERLGGPALPPPPQGRPPVRIPPGMNQMQMYHQPPQMQMPMVPGGSSSARPTYTRMALKHLSVETLRAFDIDFDYDQNPDYVLIKRWVPEWEQDQLWRHTRAIRDKRDKPLLLEEKRPARHEPEFEWVRKKHDRRRSRSKSPSLLMYLAGVKPA